ncbi:hypothetical protein, partial [Phyllobacterium sp. P5_D12]
QYQAPRRKQELEGASTMAKPRHGRGYGTPFADGTRRSNLCQDDHNAAVEAVLVYEPEFIARATRTGPPYRSHRDLA